MPRIRILPHAELCPLGDEIEVAPGTSVCEALLENGLPITSADPGAFQPQQGEALPAYTLTING